MFSGSIVALVTPMDEKGSIDKISLKKLINYHVESDTKAIVSVGTTGEASTLSHKEHYNVVMWTLDMADGKIPVIAGTSSNSTNEAISLTSMFNNSGISSCLTVTPYYNRPTQEGLFKHFKTIADNTDLPQILYNVPTRTGCDIHPSTVARLSEIKNIIGIKDSTGNLSRVSQIQSLVNENFILLSGDDITALDFMQLGGKGVISVTANIAAKEMVQICKLANEGNFTEARRLNNRLMPIHYKLFIETNPIPVKWACKYLHLIKNDTLRLPLTPLSESNKDVIKTVLNTLIL